MGQEKSAEIEGTRYSLGQFAVGATLGEGAALAVPTDLVTNIMIVAGTTFVYFLGGKIVRSSAVAVTDLISSR